MKQTDHAYTPYTIECQKHSDCVQLFNITTDYTYLNELFIDDNALISSTKLTRRSALVADRHRTTSLDETHETKSLRFTCKSST